MGNRDSALESMAWPACAGRLRTGTSFRSACVMREPDKDHERHSVIYE